MITLYRCAYVEANNPPDTQNGFAFLQALSSDIYVESPGSNFDCNSAHGGIKVRPCTTGTVSTLQLLPGQSFYLGKTILSLVPQEDGHLSTDSSSLPDSDFEHYHHQGSQTGSPQTDRLVSTVMETPMLNRDLESKHSTPILDQVTGQAISETEDIMDWPGNASKLKTMQTVRGASDNGRSSSQPELRRSEYVANVATNELDPSSPQLPGKTVERDMANATAVRLLEQKFVDLEDVEMVGADTESGLAEKLESASSIKSRIHLEGEPGRSSRSLILEKSKHLSSPLAQAGTFPGQPGGCEGLVPQTDLPTLTTSKAWSLSPARVEPERGAASDQSPIRDVSPFDPQPDGDNPVRKKAKTAAGPNEDLTEESQNNLQREVVSVQIRTSTKTDRPIFFDQTPSTLAAPSTNNKPLSGSATQPKQRSSTATKRPKHFDSAIVSDSRHHSANERPSDFSFNTTGSNPQTDWNTTSTPPSISASPYSSMRSTRSAARDEHDFVSSSNTGMRIVFASSSSAGNSKPFLKFLSKKGVKVVQSVHDCTVLCVGKELKKTSKVILAVILGKDIITDNWITDSVNGDDLLSLVPYVRISKHPVFPILGRVLSSEARFGRPDSGNCPEARHNLLPRRY